MDDDSYFRNEIALAGLDAWITREPDYVDDPPEPEPCCPEFTEACADENQQGHEHCDLCGGCVDCELAARRRAAPVAPPLGRDDEDDVAVPF